MAKTCEVINDDVINSGTSFWPPNVDVRHPAGRFLCRAPETHYLVARRKLLKELDIHTPNPASENAPQIEVRIYEAGRYSNGKWKKSKRCSFIHTLRPRIETDVKQFLAVLYPVLYANMPMTGDFRTRCLIRFFNAESREYICSLQEPYT